MDHGSPPTLVGRLPLALIGMAALIFLIESSLTFYSLDFMSDAAFSWRWAARSTAHDALSSDILCFGDSLIKFGVAPRVVESRTGRTMWNLAVTGGSPPNAYFLLRRALATGARPTSLLIDADLLSSDPFKNPYLWSHLATPLDIAEMARHGRDPDFFAHFALAWILPSVRARFEIRSQLLLVCRGVPLNYRTTSELTDRNWLANRGAAIIPSTSQLPASSVVEIDAYPREAPIPGQWTCHPTNAAYLDKFLSLAAEQGITVFWLFPPHYEMLERYLDRPNWSGLHRKFVKDRLDQYPNLVVIDGHQANYDRSAVIDVSHLNRDGAVAYSLALGDILRDYLSTNRQFDSRWIRLPVFQDPPIVAPVEDLAQSAQVLSVRR